ncbi:MAG: hypothetical protein IGS03_14200 [Candidatus Sericytochromatia bacterium]|nr:hypothetical protein [Candidatus Sericytochromatia bacterium]
MTKALSELFKEVDDRYLQSSEIQHLTSLVEAVPKRLDALMRLQQQEQVIADETAERVLATYPKTSARLNGAEKVSRDLVLTLRYCGQAMLRGEPQFLKDQLLYWLATVLQAFKFGEDVLRNSYIWLKESCQQHLSADDFALLSPYLELVIEIVPEGERAQ